MKCLPAAKKRLKYYGLMELHKSAFMALLPAGCIYY